MKPAVLYHASPNKNIQKFEPRRETFRDPREGPMVFATHDKAYASCFIIRGTPHITGRWNSGPIHHVIANYQRFKKLDFGGAIYEFSPEDFIHDSIVNNLEWVNPNPARPTGKVVYESGLQAMLENGVEVFFVDQNMLDDIERSEDHGYAILKKLKPYQNSA